MNRARPMRRALLCAACLTLSVSSLLAQDREARSPVERIPWADGPVYGGLGAQAEVEVPASCRFTDKKGAKLFMEATENPVNGSELGILLCALATDSSQWFVVFSFDEAGLVKDDEKASLDADAILASLRRGNEAGNAERRRRGWEELEIVGWEKPPYYDPETHNLTWSLRIKGKSSPGITINHSVRLLGRRGVMHADLVAEPEQMGFAVAAFDSIIGTYHYVDGQKYAEWREGDKVAAFGLTALVAGGAGVAAAKLGLFGKLWKVVLGFLIAAKKLLIVVVVAIGAFLKRVFSRNKEETAVTPAPRAAKATPARPASAPPGAYKPPAAPAAQAGAPDTRGQTGNGT
jgi:uncharacterized membrane-anchored protein